MTQKDIEGNRFIPGTIEKQAEILLRVVPVALAGGGPVMQTIQIDEWMNKLSQENHIPVRRIGVESRGMSFVDEEITGKIYPLDRPVQPGTDISDIYHHVAVTLEEEINDLYISGIRHFTGVCCGYTSYGPFAVKAALEKVNQTNPDDPMTGNLIIQDSSFPDTDKLSEEVDDSGYPITRFHGPAYQSTKDLKILFTLNASVPFDVSLSKRIPDGSIPIASVVPITRGYIEQWRKRGKQTRTQARKKLEKILPGWSKVRPDDPVIPLLASDIWNPESIGKWVTEEQYETSVKGTLNIVNALRYVGEKTGKPVFFPIVKTGAEFILSKNMDRVHSIESYNGEITEGVILVPYVSLSQPAFADLIVSSDLVINRAVQSNAFFETILASRPQLVITIPAAGYMEAELMAQVMKQGLLPYNLGAEEMGAEMLRILSDSKYQEGLVTYLNEMFDGIYSDPETNFGDVLARAAGLDSL